MCRHCDFGGGCSRDATNAGLVLGGRARCCWVVVVVLLLMGCNGLIKMCLRMRLGVGSCQYV